jgi:4'-phosphopantetheinyl transferase EntD
VEGSFLKSSLRKRHRLFLLEADASVDEVQVAGQSNFRFLVGATAHRSKVAARSYAMEMDMQADPCRTRSGLRSRSAFGELVPREVTALEDDVLALAGALFPAEAALVTGAVDKRRGEFVAGRVLARRAFGELGIASIELAADDDGVPAWPAGFVGCITHACGRAAVTIASRAAAEGLGIDMEAVARFHRGLEGHLLSPSEIERHLRGASDAERQGRSAVLFCAKEAWFKCQFPLTRRRLGFLDVELEVDWASGRFEVLACGGAPAGAAVAGCSSVQEGVARAAVVLPPGRLSAAACRAWQMPGAC